MGGTHWGTARMWSRGTFFLHPAHLACRLHFWDSITRKLVVPNHPGFLGWSGTGAYALWREAWRLLFSLEKILLWGELTAVCQDLWSALKKREPGTSQHCVMWGWLTHAQWVLTGYEEKLFTTSRVKYWDNLSIPEITCPVGLYSLLFWSFSNPDWFKTSVTYSNLTFFE